ncbi:hypothetical protein D3C74_172990 [compost metagenome]
MSFYDMFLKYMPHILELSFPIVLVFMFYNSSRRRKLLELIEILETIKQKMTIWKDPQSYTKLVHILENVSNQQVKV